jgi:hypothetical protein
MEPRSIKELLTLVLKELINVSYFPFGLCWIVYSLYDERKISLTEKNY